MWLHPITAQQISRLKEFGYMEVPCISKKLVCGDEGWFIFLQSDFFVFFPCRIKYEVMVSLFWTFSKITIIPAPTNQNSFSHMSHFKSTKFGFILQAIKQEVLCRSINYKSVSFPPSGLHNFPQTVAVPNDHLSVLPFNQEAPKMPRKVQTGVDLQQPNTCCW